MVHAENAVSKDASPCNGAKDSCYENKTLTDFNDEIVNDLNCSNVTVFNEETSCVFNNYKDVVLTGQIENTLENSLENENLNDTSCNVHSVNDNFGELRKYKLEHVKGLALGYLNVNSLLKSLHEIREMMRDGLMDIVSYGESKLDTLVSDMTIEIPNFKTLRNDASRIAHGLVTYVRSDIIHFRRLDLEKTCLNYQSIIVEVWLHKEKWLFMSLYKPPPVNDNLFMNDLMSICNKMLLETKNFVINGDLNINMLSDGNRLEEFCDTYGFVNLVKEPTCFKSINNPSLIDVVLVMQPRRFYNCITFDTGLSDCHKMICVSTKAHAPLRKPRKIKYRSFKNFNDQSYQKDVGQYPFHVFDCFDDPDDTVWAQNYALENIINRHAPLKHKTLKKDTVPYMNSELRKLIHRRNQLKNRFWRNKSQKNWQAFRAIRNKTNAVARKSQQYFLSQKCLNAKQAGDFWSAFKPYLSNKTNNNSQIILKDGGRIINSPAEVCSIFSNYYKNITDEIGEQDNFEEISEEKVKNAIDKYKNHKSIIDIKKHTYGVETFNFKPVSNDDVLRYMKKMNTNKSPGYDNVAPIFLKKAAYELCDTFRGSINMSIKMCKFPELLKRGETTPIYKSKESSSKENYRPVSVLTSLSKIWESQLSIQINKFFDNVFCNKLSAFRKQYSCEHVLINATEEWKFALDNGKCIGTVLMDLSKAFDSLPHQLLIAKLHAYGFSLDACTLVASYLSQ